MMQGDPNGDRDPGYDEEYRRGLDAYLSSDAAELRHPPTFQRAPKPAVAAEAPKVDVIDPRKWEGVPVPPRQWLVHHVVPSGNVTLLMGDGATGKSTLGLQLAVARALGKPWIGLGAVAGRTLYLSAEDDEAELHRRTDALRQYFCAEFDQLSDLILVDLVGQDAVDGNLRVNRSMPKQVPAESSEATIVVRSA